MKNTKSKSILLAWYYDYHLFCYLETLLLCLLEEGFQVTLLTCDTTLAGKYKNIKHDNFDQQYKPWLRPVMRIMDRKTTRFFGWFFGWVWSFWVSLKYDVVIAPRDNKPFQHMITAWKPAVIIQPALGFGDKLYIQHKYGKDTPFPNLLQFSKQYAFVIDYLFGCGFLKHTRGNPKKKYFTVTGNDMAEYFVKRGANPNHVYITGNPNYDGLLNISPDENLIKELGLNQKKEIYALFSSQINFSKKELAKLSEFLKILFAQSPQIHLIWKVHPTMQNTNLEALKTWLKEQKSYSVTIVRDLKGDFNNAKIIALCDGVLIEESNVGLLACLQEKPLFLISLSDVLSKQKGNFYCLFDNMMNCSEPGAFKTHLSSIKDSAFKAKIVNAQNEMMSNICKKTNSPCREIVNVIQNNI